MNVHELWSELERVRRDINTLTGEIETLEAFVGDQDRIAPRRQRLEQAEAAEREILAQLDQLASKR